MRQLELIDPQSLRDASLPALRQLEYPSCRMYLRELIRRRRHNNTTSCAVRRRWRIWRNHCNNLPKAEHAERTLVGLRRAEAIKRRMACAAEELPFVP